jgi:hypothetical protein
MDSAPCGHLQYNTYSLYLSEHWILLIKIRTDIPNVWTYNNISNFKTSVGLSYISIFSPFLTLYTLQLGHKNQLVIAV